MNRAAPYSGLAAGLAMIFDMDGVLIDSNPLHREAWAAFNRRFGLETTAAMQERMYGRRNDQIIRDFFGDTLTQEEIAARGSSKELIFRDLLASRLEEVLVPGVREFLEVYNGAPLGLATNAEPDNVDFLLDRATLRRYFRAVLNGHEVSRPKPHPEVYLLAARLLGVPRAECVVFEDSASGVAAGCAAGCTVIATTFSHEAEHLECANYLLRDLAGVEVSVLPDGEGLCLRFAPLER